jgi:hypothetical protein
MPKDVKIIHRKLGRERVWGWAHSEGVIELDERLKGYKYLLYLIHEYMHIRHPEWSERKVRSESTKMARVIWRMKHRIDNN